MSARDPSLLVIATMKNEAPYLLEWLAYHRAIGFTAFLIYTNDCTDGTDLLLDRLAQRGLVTHVRNRVLRRGPQKSALKYALAHDLYARADWVFVCDADEFLNIRTGAGRVADLIAHYPDADAIPVTWRLFSNNGLADLPTGLLTELLTDAEPERLGAGDRARFVKTLFRPAQDIERLGVHAPIYAPDARHDIRWGCAERAANPTADPRRSRAFPGYATAQVNHYAVRTVDAFLLKRERGNANHVGDTLGLAYWQRWCRGGVRDTSIQRHAPALHAGLSALRADPLTTALEAAARDIHRDRLAALLADPDYRVLRAALTGAEDTVPAPAPATRAAPGLDEIRADTARRTRAPKRLALRQKMLDEVMPKGGRCAEIGVWEGRFSAEILHFTRPRELVMVDPWDLLAATPDDTLTHARQADAEAMRAMHAQVQRLYGARADCTIRRGFSTEILAGYPDHYFDWVYIDGNHRYDFVKADLELAFRKVRPGGIVAGDDLFWKREGRLHVREAVCDVLEARDKRDVFSRRGQQYIIKVAQPPGSVG